jgi:hypothetical protein
MRIRRAIIGTLVTLGFAVGVAVPAVTAAAPATPSAAAPYVFMHS